MSIESRADRLITRLLEHPTQHDSETFQRWFKNSKVVDDFGVPKVVYHATIHWPLKDGTKLGQFTAFDRTASVRARGHTSMDAVGSWFSDSSEAVNVYGSGTIDVNRDDSVGASHYPVYLSIQRPIRLTFEEFLQWGQQTSGWTPTSKRVIKSKDPITGRPKRRTVTDTNPRGRWDPEFLRQKLKREGFDGIRFPASERIDGRDHVVWVAFEPNQIKSAIGNKGTFDRNSDHIGESS